MFQKCPLLLRVNKVLVMMDLDMGSDWFISSIRLYHATKSCGLLGLIGAY